MSLVYGLPTLIATIFIFSTVIATGGVSAVHTESQQVWPSVDHQNKAAQDNTSTHGVQVTDVKINRTEVIQRRPVGIQITVTNERDVERNHTINVTIGTSERFNTVTVESGGTKNVTYTERFESAQEVSVYVNGIYSGTIDVGQPANPDDRDRDVTVAPPTESPSSTPTNRGNDSPSEAGETVPPVRDDTAPSETAKNNSPTTATGSESVRSNPTEGSETAADNSTAGSNGPGFGIVTFLVSLGTGYLLRRGRNKTVS